MWQSFGDVCLCLLYFLLHFISSFLCFSFSVLQTSSDLLTSLSHQSANMTSSHFQWHLSDLSLLLQITGSIEHNAE